MTLLATWKAGAAYVPMEPSFPQARISHILKDAEPALVIYDDAGKNNFFGILSNYNMAKKPPCSVVVVLLIYRR